MLVPVKCFVLLSIAILLKKAESFVNLTELDSRYDAESDDLLCFSKADGSRVVRCPGGGCVQKWVISRFKVNNEYATDYYYRLGCDARTYSKTLEKFRCDSEARDGSAYTLDYMILGQNDRNQRLWIRKKCCFHSKCNRPTQTLSQRKWFKRDASMFSVMREKLKSRHVLSVVVYGFGTALAAAAILSAIRSWLKSKELAASGGRNCRELEFEIIAESEFKESSIIETNIEVTGRLTIRETARLLAMLPDQDKVKYSKSKSQSSEDSIKEPVKLPASAESTTAVDENGGRVRKVFIKSPLKTNASGWGHNLWSTHRTINSPNDLLFRMIEHGPYQYPFTALELLSLFEETAFKMADEPSLLQVDADITVFGDIRGRYVDLHRWLQLTGWPPKNRILFLGGILDSEEPGSVECLALICSLKCRFPKHVFLLRGEPETSPFRMSKRLHPVITRAIQSCIKRMCSQMPFAAVIGKSILAVYSGFSPMIREKSHISLLFRPVTAENLNAVERHIIFNQPSSKVRMYRPNPKADGDFFGKQAVRRACKAMKCNVMIRGQSCVPHGYLPSWNNRLITVWSAPGYGSNFGAVLWISKNLEITPILMEKQNENR